jgi:hypothetical protein
MKPEENSTKVPASRWTSVKKKLRKTLYLISFLIILFLTVFIYWKYFYTYSEGYRAGLLQKFTHKGNIFKTYEGELILSSVAGSTAGGTNMVIASEKFFFSVTDEDLANNLDTLQGKNVIVHYKQKNGALVWNGDTPYYVDSVRLR